MLVVDAMEDDVDDDDNVDMEDCFIRPLLLLGFNNGNGTIKAFVNNELELDNVDDDDDMVIAAATTAKSDVYDIFVITRCCCILLIRFISIFFFSNRPFVFVIPNQKQKKIITRSYFTVLDKIN